MTTPYVFIENLEARATPTDDGILSKTVHADDRLKAVLFGFSPGQELSEHTAAMPATMHFLTGEAAVTVAGDAFEVKAGAWFHMQPNVKHSIVARTPVSMLLLLLKS